MEVGIAGSYKVKHMIDPSILLLGIYLKEMKMCVHMKTYTKCSQWYYPQLPKTGNNSNILQYVNGFKKLWYMPVMEYCSAIRMKQKGIHTTR